MVVHHLPLRLAGGQLAAGGDCVARLGEGGAGGTLAHSLAVADMNLGLITRHPSLCLPMVGSCPALPPEAFPVGPQGCCPERHVNTAPLARIVTHP